MILRIHHGQIGYPKGSDEQARHFYKNVLGLKEIEKPETIRARGGFWLLLGDFQIHLSPEEGVDRKATKAHLAYEVSDLSALKTNLSREGIETVDGIPIPGWIRFDIRDPFDNRLEFLQRA